MRAILLKIWDFLTQGNHLFYTISIAAIIALFLIVRYQSNKINGLENKYQSEVKLKTALLDTVHQYKNKENEWVTEKLTLQTSVKELTNMTGQLSASQKELLARVKEVEKTNSIIAGALIDINVEIGKLRPPKVNVKDSSIVFSDSTKDIDYSIEVGHVKPIVFGLTPTLAFNKFKLPNKQFVEFHWKDDQKKLGYPIAFSVSNSNQYFKVYDINSYAIPSLVKPDNGWQRFIKWTKGNGKSLITIGLAGAAGAGAVLLLK